MLYIKFIKALTATVAEVSRSN